MTSKMYEATCLYNRPFRAVSWQEAVSLAVDLLAADFGCKAELVEAKWDGGAAACVARVTTTVSRWERGHQVEVPQVENRRFIVKPA